MGTTNILSALPPELLAHVFSCLSEIRTDISACRLTCHTFHYLSSPFLLTQVVFAKRLPALHKLLEAVEHPYFSQHVTELVFDGSTYDRELAANWDSYVGACYNTPRKLEDKEWKHREEVEKELWVALRANSNMPAYANNVRGDDSTSTIGEAHEEDEESINDLTDETSRLSRLGCFRGFPDYHQRLKEQESINATNICLTTLRMAFSRLPKLRSLVYTDYRGTAQSGESYVACVERQFGNTLEPNDLDEEPSYTGEYLTPYSDFLFMIQTIAELPSARIDSLATGPHLFELNVPHCEQRRDSRVFYPRKQSSHCFPLESLDNFGFCNFDKILKVFGKLSRLRLHFFLGERQRESLLKTTLLPNLVRAAAPTLAYLTLDAEDLLEEGSTTRSQHGQECHDSTNVDADLGVLAFGQLFSGLYMPRLVLFDLRGWLYTQNQIQCFLLQHATTLRQLRLFDNVMSDGDPTLLADFGGAKLSLGGIELDEEETEGRKRRKCSKDDMLNCAESGWWLQSRWCNHDMALEHRWLRGRHNGIRRERAPHIDKYGAHEDQAKGDWRERPSFW